MSLVELELENGGYKILPEYNFPVLTKIQHWYTQGLQEAVLIRVREDEVNWRFADDKSELSPDWNVIMWRKNNVWVSLS